MLSCPWAGCGPFFSRWPASGSPPPPPARAADGPRHDITVDARGPLALVEVTRGLSRRRSKPGAGEALLDLALPAQSALVAVEVRDRGRWRAIEAAASAAPGDAYRNESAARGVTPAAEPFDDSADYRLRVQRGSGARRGRRRPSATASRRRPVFVGRPLPRPLPAAPERLPVPADVTVTTQGARTSTSPGRGRPAGGAGRRRAAAPPRAAAGRCRGRRAIRPRPPARRRWTRAWRWPSLSPTETAIAYSVRSRPARAAGAADQRAAGHRPLAQRRAARAVGRARPRAPRAGGAAAQHALRRPVLRSRQQAAVPDEPPRDARGDRRARGRDGARADAERHRPGGGAARRGRAAAPGTEHVRAAHAAARADRRRAAAPARTAPRSTARSARCPSWSSPWRRSSCARPTTIRSAARPARR